MKMQNLLFLMKTMSLFEREELTFGNNITTLKIENYMAAENEELI